MNKKLVKYEYAPTQIQLCEHKEKTCVVENSTGQWVLFDKNTGEYVTNFSNTKTLKNARWVNKDRWAIFEKRWIRVGYTTKPPKEALKACEGGSGE